MISIRFIIAALCVVATAATISRAQNIVGHSQPGPVLEAVQLTDADIERVLADVPPAPPTGTPRELLRVQAKLEKHVLQLVEGHPWRPLHITHGISGYEAYFTHPDEFFYVLSLAQPLLPADLKRKVGAALSTALDSTPPYGEAGFDAAAGRARELYDVPEEVRRTGPFSARSLFGVYAFWLYTQENRPSQAALKRHWQAIRKRCDAVLAKPYAFDVKKLHSKDEAEHLNGDIAGLIGFVRLAKSMNDADAQSLGTRRLREAITFRINLERVNAQVVEPTESTSSKLHIFKLARYLGLTHEVAGALRTHADVAATRIAAEREARPTWWLASGDRLIGGENYTNPPHLSRALFVGATLVERQPISNVAAWLDVPWCRGDVYFIEKAATALRTHR